MKRVSRIIYISIILNSCDLKNIKETEISDKRQSCARNVVTLL